MNGRRLERLERLALLVLLALALGALEGCIVFDFIGPVKRCELAPPDTVRPGDSVVVQPDRCVEDVEPPAERP